MLISIFKNDNKTAGFCFTYQNKVAEVILKLTKITVVQLNKGKNIINNIVLTLKSKIYIKRSHILILNN